MTQRSLFWLVLALLAQASALVSPSARAELVSPWSEDKFETKARLIAGQMGGKSIAAVEITLTDGWKTYWRFPGDAGGVPPMFDWAKSANVARVKVLYPAPKRLTGPDGDSLGYKGTVVFPVLVEASDPSQPVSLKLALDYGICREVCVPVETALNLDIPAGDATPLPPQVAAALDHVPHAGDAQKPGDPKLISALVKLDGPAPSITLDVELPGGTANADAYVESPAGYYIPLPKAGSAKQLGPDRVRFEIDLTGAVDPADIKGKTATVTLVSEKGLSEATFVLE